MKIQWRLGCAEQADLNCTQCFWQGCYCGIHINSETLQCVSVHIMQRVRFTTYPLQCP